mmetsp:Transcript_19826/g.22830  ORF Transcript_19826/g.22830 Transcript_19826/m.22830 type:complete len:307 (-) Transcript_19826:504-1424(-)
MSGTNAPERDVEMPDASAFSTGAEEHEQNENNMAISSNRMNEDRGSEPVRQNDSGEDDGLVLMDNRKQYAVSVRWEQSQGDEVARRQEFLRSGKKHPCRCFCCEECSNRPRPCSCTLQDFNGLCCWPCCTRRRIGAMTVLCEYSDGTPIVVAGPCWPFCAFFTVPLIVVISFLVTYFIIFNGAGNLTYVLPWWVSLIYIPFIFLTLVALCCVSCSDPGMLERVTDEEAGHGGWFWNEQTRSYRPAGAMYCRECKVLIQEYDHLCPWTGTGIGRGNMRAFKCFVGSVNILCYLSIGLVAFVLLNGVK